MRQLGAVVGRVAAYSYTDEMTYLEDDFSVELPRGRLRNRASMANAKRPSSASCLRILSVSLMQSHEPR
jgi:hypothetical protein